MRHQPYLSTEPVIELKVATIDQAAIIDFGPDFQDESVLRLVGLAYHSIRDIGRIHKDKQMIATCEKHSSWDSPCGSVV